MRAVRSSEESDALAALLRATAFVDRTTVLLEVSASLTSEWTTIFQGVVDHIELEPLTSSLILECRDYLALLIDLRVASSWLNMTGAELAEAAILEAGLIPGVEFTAAMVGQFWQIDHRRTSAVAASRFQSAYDLVLSVASSFGCELYAMGRKVMCVPIVLEALDPGTVGNVQMEFSSASTGADFCVRHISVARDLVNTSGLSVQMLSWDSRQRSKGEVSVQGGSVVQSATRNSAAFHSFRMPGLREDDLQRVAIEKYNALSAHEYVVRVEGPANTSIGARSFLRLGGTGTAWDRVYSVDQCIYRFDSQEGFTQAMTLRDRSGALA
ncbi:hypothetical protein KGY14_11545 [Ameyamaea chiangmaiensis]|uniref:Uncharacterized protein n=1 Tax=Ameyamaea chiangmaiensis TaxID=442969 RepID=A0A850P3R3_9PROT|nr:hypothetical protein [Ameyamaea chiangmaiensis]MBS4075824.1 hypothetical protein [Ameyamaea chiangmaiensis]NVN39305.1 hypothetical protein [Ameyamaea chiangmaiensis]